MDTSIQKILNHFDLLVKPSMVFPLGNGLINSTYVLIDEKKEKQYVLQRINNLIFKDVELLQKNIHVVTTHIRKKLLERKEEDIERKVLHLVPTTDGEFYYFDGVHYWRVYNYIRNSITLQKLTPQSSFLSGKMFGDFQYMLSDLPENSLKETIPGFHNMNLRLEQMYQAIKEDRLCRVQDVKHIIEEIEKRVQDYCIQESLFEKGELKKRINHCDTKLNNILFDDKTGIPLCVVDLDTVMPGFVLSDFGDFIRTGANEAVEDEYDLTKIKLKNDIIVSYADGYLSQAAMFLTEREVNLLSYGPLLQTYMQMVRFFTDYLNGDVYYKVSHRLHNLQRTYSQLFLLRQLEASYEMISNKIQDLYLKYKKQI